MSNPNNFSSDLLGELNNWTADIQQEVRKLTDIKAKELQRIYKKESPRRTGAYAQSWRIKTTEDSAFRYERTVYSAKPHYRLTHLLENGHDLVRNGRVVGHVRPRTHLAPYAELIQLEFESDIEKIIQTSSKAGGGRRK